MTSFRYSLTIAATCALLLCAPAARAEPAPRSDRIWTLEDAKSAVLARSTLVAGIDARLAARLAEAADITRFHNPEVSAEFRAPSSRRERETEVEVSIGQPLRLSSSSLRSEVRMLLEKTASSEQRIEILEL